MKRFEIDQMVVVVTKSGVIYRGRIADKDSADSLSSYSGSNPSMPGPIVHLTDVTIMSGSTTVESPSLSIKTTEIESVGQ